MKEIWKKSSLFYKMIAVLLTVVMVGTTLYFHFDKKYVAKAADEVSISQKYLKNGDDATVSANWKDVNGTVYSASDDTLAWFVTINVENYASITIHDANSNREIDVPKGSLLYGSSSGYGFLSLDSNIFIIKNISGITLGKITTSDNPAQSIDISSFTLPEFTTDDGNLNITEAKIFINSEDTTGTDFNGGSFVCGKDSRISIKATCKDDITGLKIFGEDVINKTGVTVTSVNNLSVLNCELSLYDFLGDTNKDLNSGTVVVSAGGSSKTKTCASTSCIYDVSEPAIAETLETNQISIKTPATIFKQGNTGVNIKYTLSSGNSSPESDLKLTDNKSYYEIDGAKNYFNVYSGTITLHNSTDTEQGTLVKFHIEDAAGNKYEEEFRVKVDSGLPSITSVRVVQDGQPKDLSGWFNKDDILEIEASDTYGIKNISVINGTLTSTIPNSASYSLPIWKALGYDDNAADGIDGIHDITIKVEDIAVNYNDPTDSQGNPFELSNYTLRVDSKAPVEDASETAIKGFVTNVDSSLDVIGSESIDGDTLYINKDVTPDLYYKIKIYDPGDTSSISGLAQSNMVLNVSGTETVASYTPAQIGEYYYFRIPLNNTDIQVPGTPVAYTISAKDNAGNKLELPIPTKVCVIDSSVRFKDITLTDEAGNIIAGDETALAGIDDYSNKVYTLKVTAISGKKITEIGLKDDSGNIAKYVVPEPYENYYIEKTKFYTVSNIEFKIPADELNKSYSSLKVYALDEANSPYETGIGLLMYDSTLPVLRSSDGSTKIDTDTEWHKSYTIPFSILSGLRTTESPLVEAGYKITGSDAAADKDYTPSGSRVNDEVVIPESNNVGGTTITFSAKDSAKNTMQNVDGEKNTYTIKVDATDPKINKVTANGNEANEIPLEGNPSIAVDYCDNLTLGASAITVTMPDGTTKFYPCTDAIGEQKDIAVSKTYELSTLIDGVVSDGTYKVNLGIKDKAGNSASKDITFVVDNTAPVVTASIINGTAGKNNGYYNTDVVVRLTCKDNNFDPLAMSVTDNGSAVNANWQVGNDIYYADVTLSSEGLHDIRVSGNDKAGTAAEAKQVTFIIDKTVPTVSLLVNGGQVYNESRGTLNLTGPLTLTASVTDTNEDANDLRIQVIKTVPDTATTTSEYAPTGTRTFTFSDEADYTINIFAVDKANNQGATRTISFRVDTTAPQLTISGANGGTSASATSVSFNINEAFWSDAKGSVEIYRKAGDGVDETLYKTLTLSPTQRSYSLSELLNESGVYRFEFTAEDKVGHTATTSQKLTVDKNKPEITLTGVKNYDSTDGAVSIAATIADEFYANKKVNISGTRIDANGKKTALSFSPYAATANPTTINDTFTEEGIYDITISATDIAGNVSSNSVHFTIDTSAPIIGDLSEYDGKTFNKIDLDIDLDELVSDLTVCDVRMYLNGSEYDGISDIDDGSYTLLITAEDELGHSSEKSVTFILDTKEPIFIVTGVEDGEIRNDTYSIEVSLQLDEDTLDAVKLNDKDITIKNNVASINVTDKGEYELYMKAYDEAGNEAEQTITFTFGEESVATVVTNAVEKAASHWWMWAIVVAAIFAVGGFIFFILKRKKDNE